MHGIFAQVANFRPVLNEIWFGAIDVTELGILLLLLFLTDAALALDQALRRFVLRATAQMLILGCAPCGILLALFQSDSVGGVA